MLEYIVSGLTLLLLLVVGIVIICSTLCRLLKKISSLRQNGSCPFSREERYRVVLSNAPIILFELDANGIFTLSEGRGLQTLGIRAGDWIGRSVFDVHPHDPQILADTQRALAGETLTGRVYCVCGHTFETRWNPLCSPDGKVARVICVAIDISDRASAERALQHQAHYDALTDLPNRALLFERIAQAQQNAEQSNTGVALLMLGLNRFQEINDTFGHQQGDLLLQQVKQRLCQVVDTSVTVARLGGDEFAILLPEADENSALETTARLRSVLEGPFPIEEGSMHIEASISIVLSPMHGSDPLTLLRRADVAMHVAKREHKAYVLYEPELDRYTPRRLTLLGTLRTSIANGDMSLYYQPKVDLKTGITHGVEALIRWHHPECGMVPPDQFIPLAEHTGLIEPLTAWVVENAIKQCGEWLSKDLKLTVSVNLSVCNLREEDLPDRVAVWLEMYDVPARFLCMEVTESAVMIDVEQAMEILNRLFMMGVRISIDDFGTGYSSLAYLKSLPVDELKIDRTFVQQMTNSRADMTIVQSTVSMAHRLGLSVVAEGVENQEVWDMLVKFGCDCAQGYYLSRPVIASELEEWLQQHSRQLVAL